MESIDKILNLLNNRGVSAYQLSKETGIANNLVSQWKQHKQNPSIKSMKKVAKYFNVPWESLMSDEDENASSLSLNEALNKFNKACNYREIYFDNNELKYLNELHLLNESGIQKVLEYIADISTNPKYSKNKAEE